MPDEVGTSSNSGGLAGNSSPWHEWVGGGAWSGALPLAGACGSRPLLLAVLLCFVSRGISRTLLGESWAAPGCDSAGGRGLMRVRLVGAKLGREEGGLEDWVCFQ